MTNPITLELRGLLWKHLLIIERNEIANQFPKILSDRNFDKYRFLKCSDGTWSIPNAMTLPLETSKMGL